MRNKTSFKVPQKAVLRKAGKYLVVKRALTESNYPGYWDFPGGKLEHGENPYRSVEREVKEETGLRIKARKPVFVFSEKHYSRKKEYVTFIVYDCKILGGKLRLSREHTDAKWVNRNELKKMKKTENFLKAYLKGL